MKKRDRLMKIRHSRFECCVCRH